MSRKTKNIITTVILVLALLQGPYFYYFCYDFQIIIQPLYLLIALYLIIYLLINILKHKSTTSIYHIIGLAVAIMIGVFTLRNNFVEYFDFKLRKQERMAVIKQLTAAKLIPDTANNRHSWIIPNAPFFCISKRNEIDVDENKKGRVVVKFYTYLGFLDDDSKCFLYTNDPIKIESLDKRISNGVDEKFIKKLDTNWYSITE